MIRVNNLLENDNIVIREQGGPFTVIEYKRDLSVTPATAQTAFFMHQMNARRRQVVCQLKQSAVTLQAGSMQYFAGSIQMTTGLKGAGDLAKKLIASKATKESTIKPEYVGSGILVTEPTYKHLLIEDVSDWESGLVIQDGMFLASEQSVQLSIVARASVSSAIAGGEGLFNLCLRGNGYVVLESSTPRKELVEVELDNDVIKIDGSFAIAWSQSLKFTVERSSKTLVGSAASGEGLVNVYRGTGRILMAPLD